MNSSILHMIAAALLVGSALGYPSFFPSQHNPQHAPLPVQTHQPATKDAPATATPSAIPPIPIIPMIPGSSIQLEKAGASARGNNTMSVGAEHDRAAAAGNTDGDKPIYLGAQPGAAFGFMGPFAQLFGNRGAPIATPAA